MEWVQMQSPGSREHLCWYGWADGVLTKLAPSGEVLYTRSYDRSTWLMLSRSKVMVPGVPTIAVEDGL